MLATDDQLRHFSEVAAEELEWRKNCDDLIFHEPKESVARRHLLEFIRLGFREYQVGWFHRELCREMEAFSHAVANRESPRVMIEVPPQHGKSEIVSRRWPVWHLGLYPDHKMVVATYGQDLANKMSRSAQAIRNDALTIWPHLAPGAENGVEFWSIKGLGSYNAVGVGGPLTGMGAHCLVIDDPFKNSDEADSQTIRDSRWSWYQSTAYTRLAPGGGILVMNTRWHEDDLSGRLLAAEAKGGDAWRRINCPAIAEVDELFRSVGEALHPERYDAEYLNRTKINVGSRVWAALFQQRPSPAEGNLFKRDWMRNVYHFDPQRPVFDGKMSTWDAVYVSLDATFKKSKKADYVSIQAWGIRGSRLYLLDEIHEQMGYVGTREALRRFCHKWRPRAVVVEDKANGSAIIDELGEEIPGIVAFNPNPYGDKVSRAGLITPRWEAGDVWLPSEEVAPWVGDYIEEHCSFPNGRFDDRVDCESQLLIWLGRKRSSASRAERFAQGAQLLLDQL